jgi:PKD repeat protein
LGDAGEDDIYGHARTDASTAVQAAMSPVSNQPPVAYAVSDVSTGIVPLNVIFYDDASFNPDCDPISYSWDYGDGSSVFC